MRSWASDVALPFNLCVAANRFSTWLDPTLQPAGVAAPTQSSKKQYSLPDATRVPSGFEGPWSSIPFPWVRLRDVEIQQTL